MTKSTKREIAKRIEELEETSRGSGPTVTITHVSVDADGVPTGLSYQLSGDVMDGLDSVPADEIEPKAYVWVRDEEGEERCIPESFVESFDAALERIDDRDPIVLEPETEVRDDE